MIYLRKIFLIVTLLGVTLLCHDLGGDRAGASPAAGAVLALGFLLLFAFICGRLSRLAGAPMITGYLLAGAVAGPYALNIVSAADAEPLRLIDNIALGLIAFAAGGELNIRRFGPRFSTLARLAGVQTVVTFMAIFLCFIPLFALFGQSDAGFTLILSAALLLGVIATANSPATAIAVIAETGAKGAVSDTIIGTTVFKDLLVILLFALAVSLVKAMNGVGGGGFSFATHIAMELALSLVIGSIVGALVIGYLRATSENVPLFLLGMVFITVEICSWLGMGPLLAAIAAGFMVENASQEGERLIEGLETSSLPIFVIFFSLAGQSLDFGSLADTWPLATAFVAIRIYSTRAGVLRGLKGSDDGDRIGRHAWAGFVGQAGVSLGFATIIARTFPSFGPELASLVVAAVAINQIIGPIMMKQSLAAAGEIPRDEEE